MNPFLCALIIIIDAIWKHYAAERPLLAEKNILRDRNPRTKYLLKLTYLTIFYEKCPDYKTKSSY